MSIRHQTGLSAAVVAALAITVAGCDSALITGSGDAPSIGAAMATPETQLLSDGSFELGADAWQLCSENGNSELISDASEGAVALQVGNGACRYQNHVVEVGKSYRLNCEAKRTTDRWSGITLAFLDQNYRPIDTHEVSVESDTWAPASITMTAPEFSSHSEVLFYSEGDMTVDNCELTEVTIDAPSLELQNASFTNGLDAWSQCAGNDAAVNNGVASLAGGACISQTIDVSSEVAASAANNPVTINFQCDQITSIGDQYAAVIVAFLDANNAPVASAEQPIIEGTTSTSVRLSAADGAQTLEVMLYGAGQTSIGQCGIVTL